MKVKLVALTTCDRKRREEGMMAHGDDCTQRISDGRGTRELLLSRPHTVYVGA